MARVGSMVSALLGAALLAVVVPRRNPWDLTLFRTSTEAGHVDLTLFGSTVTFHPLALYGVLAAALAVLAAGLPACRRAVAGVPSTRSLPAVAVVLLALTLVPSDKGSEIVLALVLGSTGVVLLTAGLAAAVPGLPVRVASGLRAALRWVESLTPARFSALVFGIVFASANLGAWLVFGHIPHIVDSAVQLFHAKVFLGGRLVAGSPDGGEFFAISHMIDNGRWYSQYPPGHILLLAAGQMVRAPWIVNPLCGALSVVLLYPLGRAMFDERTGRVAALLGTLSPFVWLMSSSFMSHTTTLLFLELFLLGFVGLLGRGRPLDALMAGGGLGIAACIRPMTAAAVAAPFLLYGAGWVALRVFRQRGKRDPTRAVATCLLAAVIGCIPIGGMLAYNDRTNGDPLVFGYEQLHGEKARPGFGNTGWWQEPHTPRRGLTWTMQNLNALNQYLLGFPLPSLALALLGLAWSRPRSWDVLLWASAGALLLAYFFYWYHDWALGPRFMYSATAALLLLTARGLVTLPGRLRGAFPPASAPAASGIVGLGLVLCAGYALAAGLPSLAAFYSRNYADGNAAVTRAVQRQQVPGSIVFAPGRHYVSVFPLNDPDLAGPVIYARDYGPGKSAELMRRHPDRKPFRLVAGEDYRLAPYDGRFSEPLTWTLEPGEPLTVEMSTTQASFFEAGFWRDQPMGEWGRGWQHHDQLLITARQPGARVGLLLHAEVAETRRVRVALTRGPGFGIVEIRAAGAAARTVDLDAPDVRPQVVTIEDVPFRRGPNRISLTVVGKHPSSRSFGFGIDYVSVEAPGDRTAQWTQP